MGQGTVARRSLLAYASADVSATGSLPKLQNPMLGGSAPYDRETAVYDISARKVYLPDGTVLEAHSGLGAKMDDVRYAHVRMQGVTPPHIYDLKPREALFHGVPALRLTPIGGEDKIFDRDGLLAHTYMLGGRRRFQRLHVVQGLLRLPRRLPQRRHPADRGGREGGVSAGAGRRPRCSHTLRLSFPDVQLHV